MAISSTAATTFLFFLVILLFFMSDLSISFISFADSAGLLFNARKCTALSTVSKISPYLRIRVSDSAVAFAGGRHFLRCELSRRVKQAVCFSQLPIHDMSGGEEAENVRRTLSFMKKTSCFAVIDAVDIGHLRRRGEIPNLVIFSVKNFSPRIKFANFHHILPSEIENRGLVVEIPSDLEEHKHDSLMRLRRRALQIDKTTKKWSDFQRSAAEIVTVPSTFPGNTAAAAAAAATTDPTTVTVPSTIPGVNVPGMATSYSGKEWCVGKKGAVEEKLQEALDYACGMGGVDCRQIQVGGICYDPNTVQSHASYAFNMYYQRLPSPSSCDFDGSGEIVDVNPSTETCVYPSSSTASPETTSPFPPPSSFPATSTTPSGAGAGGGGFSTSSTNNGATTTTTPGITGPDSGQTQPSLDNNISGNVVRRAVINTKLLVFLMLMVWLFFAHHPCDEKIISVMRF